MLSSFVYNVHYFLHSDGKDKCKVFFTFDLIGMR